MTHRVKSNPRIASMTQKNNFCSTTKPAPYVLSGLYYGRRREEEETSVIAIDSNQSNWNSRWAEVRAFRSRASSNSIFRFRNETFVPTNKARALAGYSREVGEKPRVTRKKNLLAVSAAFCVAQMRSARKEEKTQLFTAFREELSRTQLRTEWNSPETFNKYRRDVTP